MTMWRCRGCGYLHPLTATNYPRPALGKGLCAVCFAASRARCWYCDRPARECGCYREDDVPMEGDITHAATD